MDTGRINERNLSHSNDTDFRAVFGLQHDFLKFVGNTEEVRAVDFVGFYVFWDDKMLFLTGNGNVFGVDDLVADAADLDNTHHTLDEQQASQYQSEFNGDGQVEDYGKQESDEQYRYV